MAAVVMDSAGLVEFFAEIHEASDEQVQAAIFIVVEPHGAGSPSGSGESRFFRYIEKRSVSVIVIKDAAAVLGDVQVRKTVAVEIPDRDALSKDARSHTGFFRYVGERPVAIVLIQRVAQRGIGIVEIALAAVDQINVHPAIIVV